MTAAHVLPICTQCGFVKKSVTITDNGEFVAEMPCERCFLNRLHFVGERYQAALRRGVHPNMAARAIETGFDDAMTAEIGRQDV